MKSIYFILICFVTLNAANGQNINYGNNPNAAKYYNIRGINIYTEQYGNGKPLLMLHGNGGSIASMASIIPYFSNKYRVIAIDSRAHGKSIDTNDSLSFEMMADDISVLLDSMRISSAYLIGWSDGGIITIEMALRHPEKIIKLVSTGANLWPDSRFSSRNVELYGENISREKRFTNNFGTGKTRLEVFYVGLVATKYFVS
ncbi:MAG: alpha/beta hydrolase [Paludibacteraceae bacterium]